MMTSEDSQSPQESAPSADEAVTSAVSGNEQGGDSSPRPQRQGAAPAGRGRGNGPQQGGPGQRRRDGGPGGRGPKGAEDPERSEWKEKVIQIRRVTKVVKGGKKLSFRAVVVVGNGKGEVGMGVGKSNEVIGAIQKAVSAAKKSLVKVPLHNQTIPHDVTCKTGGSIVVLRRASKGTGVIAGGAARALLELAGIENILSKSLGSNSPLNVARATLKCLSDLRTFEQIAQGRGKSVREILL